MSVVWSCNEWDQLEEVIVGNPLHARFPTADRNSNGGIFRSFAGRNSARPAFAAVYTHPTPLGS
jgi:hypothetical protein